MFPPGMASVISILLANNGGGESALHAPRAQQAMRKEITENRIEDINCGPL
jgi:hypothetical protein